MAVRIPLFLLCAFLLRDTLSADEAAPKKEVKAKRVVAVAGAGRAVQVLKKDLEARRAAEKKLAEAIQAENKAKNAVAQAEKEAAAAQGEEKKKAAIMRVEKAKKQLDDAKQVVAKQRAENRKIAGQAAVVRRSAVYANTVVVRENVDPHDPIERFMLLTTGGPLVVQVAMTIDGKPFRTKREELIDDLLAAADTDGDSKPRWEEALKSSRFTLGRVRIANEQQRESYLKAWDKNENDLVDRSEARMFVAQVYRAPTFTLGGGYGYGYYGRGIVVSSNGRFYRGGGQADVKKLLDQDEDGVLSEKEIATAGGRLKSRDADDNDLLLPSEISGPATVNTRQIRAVTRQPQQQLAVLLGPTAKAEPLFKAIQGRYKNDDGEVIASSFQEVPKLYETLDKNSDGKLQQVEVLALNEVEPHLDLAVDLGKSKGPTGLTVTAISSELTKSEESNESVSVELPGIKMSFVANLAATRTYNYASTAKSYLTRFDKDSNGYLEKKELPANFVRQFDIWDGDKDAKVYEKEITASYTRMLAPQMSQIRANASSQGNSLFQALDISGDGRLSLREMKTADQRLKKFDENEDNQITQAEVPISLSVHFGLGNAGFTNRGSQGARPTTTRPANSDAPTWFTRMDRNGDGDLTLKEFLGDKEEFKRLDTNSDGFIEPNEAKAVSNSN